MLARIALFVCLASVAVGDLANQPTHKFNAFSRAVDWTLGGSAQFVAHALRLTPDSPSRSGFVFSRRPVASDDKEWAIDLEFRIFGQGVTLFGDGIALWLTREQFKPGRRESSLLHVYPLHCPLISSCLLFLQCLGTRNVGKVRVCWSRHVFLSNIGRYRATCCDFLLYAS